MKKKWNKFKDYINNEARMKEYMQAKGAIFFKSTLRPTWLRLCDKPYSLNEHNKY